jgi:hypothetical protein
MEWISVKDRLPKKGYYHQIVAVNMKRGTNQIFLVDYIDNEECFVHPNKDITVGGDWVPLEITHWLEIPKLPDRIKPK